MREKSLIDYRTLKIYSQGTQYGNVFGRLGQRIGRIVKVHKRHKSNRIKTIPDKMA
jgi:hypothetical protein